MWKGAGVSPADAAATQRQVEGMGGVFGYSPAKPYRRRGPGAHITAASAKDVCE